MKIQPLKINVTVTFSSKDYWLVNFADIDSPFPNSLNLKVDRSDKGKDDDIGIAVLYLDKYEAQVFRKAGFDEATI